MNFGILEGDEALEATDGGTLPRKRRSRAALDRLAGCMNTQLQVFDTTRLRLKQQIVRLQEYVIALGNVAGQALHIEARDRDGESTTVIFEKAPVISRAIKVAICHIRTAAQSSQAARCAHDSLLLW